MTVLRRSRPPIVWLLLAAALLLRAALPAGWMPAAGQDGVRIALCTSNGSEFAVLTRDGKLHKQAPKPAAPREICPYALAASGAANVPPVVPLQAQLVTLAPLNYPASAAIALVPIIFAHPPARGPPALT